MYCWWNLGLACLLDPKSFFDYFFNHQLLWRFCTFAVILFMFQCNLLDVGRRPGEFMYYYFSNHCKCDIVIRKYIMLLTCLGGNRMRGRNLFVAAVTMWSIHKSKFRYWIRHTNQIKTTQPIIIQLGYTVVRFGARSGEWSEKGHIQLFLSSIELVTSRS